MMSNIINLSKIQHQYQMMFLRKAVFIRRFCTFKPERFSDLQVQKLLQQQNPLKDLITQELLHTNGQMKLSRYWDLCLTHPEHGFYSQKKVFSKQGHFTTSPEISSIFGEIIGVWVMHFISSIGKKYLDLKSNANNTLSLRPFRLVELGPGRGLLMADILRCISQLNGLEFLESVSMIQVSASNSESQQKNVMDELAKKDYHFSYQYNNQQGDIFKGENNKVQLRWFKNLFQMLQKQNMPKELSQDAKINQTLPPFTIIVAHQFFDALPTQSLVYTPQGWRSKVIRLNSDNNLVLVPSSYPLADKMTPIVQNPEVGSTIQVSHQSLMLIESLSEIISRTNGVILNIDYGNYFSHSDSIRAIRQHKFVPYPGWINMPGLCDLSSYVDFSALQQFAQKVEGIKGYEPVAQGFFLQAMGINLRIQVLSKGKSEQVKNRIQEDYKRLVSPEMMGQIYKVQMITLKENQEVYPFITDQDENVF